MKPRVINIKDAPQGWENDPNYVYIGRKGRGFSGAWGNPHILAHVGSCPICSKVQGTPVYHQDRGSTLKYYEAELRVIVQKFPKIAESIKGFAGKTLVCFCKPQPCHGDILATVCEELNNEV